MRAVLLVAYFLVLMSLVFLPLNGLLYVTASVPIVGLIATIVLIVAWAFASIHLALKAIEK